MNMTTAFKVVAISVGAVTFTALGRAVFADASPPQITGGWLVDMRTLCAVGGVVLLGTWRLGRWMKNIDDTLRNGDQRFDRIESNMKARDDALAEIRRKIDTLP